MSMSIQTNIAAMDAHRNLVNTTDELQTSMERLSSGYRINSAADDAAGLAISEKLDAQVSGLQQATAERPGRRIARADRRRGDERGADDAAARS